MLNHVYLNKADEALAVIDMAAYCQYHCTKGNKQCCSANSSCTQLQLQLQLQLCLMDSCVHLVTHLMDYMCASGNTSSLLVQCTALQSFCSSGDSGEDRHRTLMGTDQGSYRI